MRTQLGLAIIALLFLSSLANAAESTLGPGIINFEEIHVHAGDTLTILPGTELVRNDVPPQDPAHGDGGIVVHGTLIAVRTPSEPPIIIRSANPAGYRGHIMVHGIAQFDGVKIVDMGRTTIAQISTSNPIARYALHWHLAGNSTGSRVENCEIYDTIIPSPRRYGVAIHGTNNVVIRNNFIHHKGGAGIFLEDGTETGNLIEGNTIEDIHGSGYRPDAYNVMSRGHDGSGIWLRSGANIVRNNTVRRCKRAGILYFTSDVQNIQECKGNFLEACWDGLEIWTAGGPTSVIEDLTVRNCTYYGYYNYNSADLKFLNLDIEGCKVGVFGGDYKATNHVYEGGRIANCERGIEPSTKIVGNPLLITGMTMSGNDEDIRIRTLYHNSGWTACTPRSVIIRNCQLQSAVKIKMLFYPTGNTHLLQTDEVHVEDWQGTPGLDYRVYYAEQAPNFIIPMGIHPTLSKGAEAPNLTNTQHLATYGTCIAGSIAPCSTAVPGIVGFACPE